MRKLYLCVDISISKILEEMFTDFETHLVSKEYLKNNNLTNKNILLVLAESVPLELSEVFFLNNNVVILFLKQNNLVKNKHFNAKIFSGQLNINKFKDEVITFFESKPFIYYDIKIWGEKIINLKTEKEIFLTLSEKKILILLFERKKLEKNFLLENVLNLRKDTETKTIESHLTRIRKKLQSIDSNIEIILKENTVFLVI